jgi:hypothetical protein
MGLVFFIAEQYYPESRYNATTYFLINLQSKYRTVFLTRQVFNLINESDVWLREMGLGHCQPLGQAYNLIFGEDAFSSPRSAGFCVKACVLIILRH